MLQSEIIPDSSALLAPRSIQEDEIPRNGGLWPEYAHTLVVCVDCFRGELAKGRVYCCCVPNARTFQSLDQLLFRLEELLEDTGLVQTWNRPRGVAGKRRRRRTATALEEEQAPVRPPLALQDFQPQRGELASFYLRVYSRQHASMQGVLVQAAAGSVPTAFRSALELARMLRETLRIQAESRKENHP